MRVFGHRRMYADAAAATPLGKEAAREYRRLLPLFANPGSLHREGVAAKSALERARQEAARAIDAHADEIVFTGSGTEGNALALGGVFSRKERGKASHHIITTVLEHPSVLAHLSAHEGASVSVTRLPVAGDGRVDPTSLRDAICGNTRLVSVQYVNSEIGVVQPLREIAKVIRDVNKGSPKDARILFHTDASQAPLYLSCRVDELHVDLMTLDGQKIGGPKGVGALYVRRGVALEPLIHGGGQERGLRSGTENVPAIGAFARALTLAQAGYTERALRIAPLRDRLLEELATVSGVSINGSREARIANNANVSVSGCEGEELVLRLDALGVAASARSACSMEEGGASYVIEALGRGADAALSSVRLTLLPDATAHDVTGIVRAFKKSVALARSGKEAKFD